MTTKLYPCRSCGYETSHRWCSTSCYYRENDFSETIDKGDEKEYDDEK